MAKWFIPTSEQIASYAAWVAERPPAVRAIASRFTPWELYRLKTTDQRVTVVSVYENGTLRVNDSSQFDVFGVNPDDLEPCEVPEYVLDKLRESV
jgi:hypothetical protein